MPIPNPTRQSGFTILELAIAVMILAVLMGSAATALNSVQDTFVESEAAGRVALQAERAMNRLTQLLTQAVTVDGELANLNVSGDGDTWTGMKFRLVESVDDGNVVYDDIHKVFICGPAEGPMPCAGLVAGRAVDAATVYNLASGDDGVLGTTDDDTRASNSGILPAVEMLIPSTYAPRTGDMVIMSQPTGSPRLVEITLRMNLQRKGEFLLPEDFEITERVAFRQ